MSFLQKCKRCLEALLLFIAATLCATVVLYLAFALLFDTDIENKLKKENRMYAELLPKIQQGEERRSDAVAYLQHRDSVIYNLVFHSGAPELASMIPPPEDIDIDTLVYDRFVIRVADRRRETVATADRVDSLMKEACRFLSSVPSSSLPPMILPARGVTCPQMGAGAGNRINPFLKASVMHNGLDLVLERGDTVYANAPGKVVIPKGLPKSHGIVLEIDHGNGYVTRMEHLESVLAVNGAKVAAGEPVATVGMTGNSVAPHLHYTIMRGARHLDPLDYFFASVSPQDYVNMLYMSSKTIQSLD